MAFQQRPNSGALFPPKEPNPADSNRPNATGPLVVECPHCKAVSKFEISAWTKVPKSGGKKFMSLSVKVAKGGAGKPPAPPSDAAADAEPDKPLEERVAF